MGRFLRAFLGLDFDRARAYVRSQMFINKRRAQVLGLIAVAALGIFILVEAGKSDRRDSADFDSAETTLTEQEAVDISLQRTRELGFEEAPSVWLARRISFGEYSTLAGDRSTAFAGTPDVAPSAVTWVVSMRGNWGAPLIDDTTLEFDNLTVVIDAVSGATLQAATFFEEFESDVRIPIFYSPDDPCDEDDLGVLRKIFRSNCPYPVPTPGAADENSDS
jgi:hypothetical protein